MNAKSSRAWRRAGLKEYEGVPTLSVLTENRTDPRNVSRENPEAQVGPPFARSLPSIRRLKFQGATNRRFLLNPIGWEMRNTNSKSVVKNLKFDPEPKRSDCNKQ
ncbi:hypothetical protein EFP84_06115 [Leptospira kmetyi]|uniref:Uncharacterized protein n=1 Tax=Leptospira kmetyi TaxID=408139 RepID=A0AAD0UMP2_9LEPT|nr:hypothetical protein EFP84_06115 [Leptospira kmetyi]